MFKLPIPTRLTDYLGEAVVWTVILFTEQNTINEKGTVTYKLQRTQDAEVTKVRKPRENKKYAAIKQTLQSLT